MVLPSLASQPAPAPKISIQKLAEKLLAAEPINRKSGVLVTGLSSRAGKPQEVELVGPTLSFHNGTRARKGKLLATHMKANRLQALG